MSDIETIVQEEKDNGRKEKEGNPKNETRKKDIHV